MMYYENLPRTVCPQRTAVLQRKRSLAVSKDKSVKLLFTNGLSERMSTALILSFHIHSLGRRRNFSGGR